MVTSIQLLNAVMAQQGQGWTLPSSMGYAKQAQPGMEQFSVIAKRT
jgi:hypothetical protein